jgi:hypothetical protein
MSEVGCYIDGIPETPEYCAARERYYLSRQMGANDERTIAKELQYRHEQYLGDSMIIAKQQAEINHHDTLIFWLFVVLIISAVGFGANLFLHRSTNRKERALALRNRWSGWN